MHFLYPQMTKHLTLLVQRIFPIFLFIGLAWGQVCWCGRTTEKTGKRDKGKMELICSNNHISWTQSSGIYQKRTSGGISSQNKTFFDDIGDAIDRKREKEKQKLEEEKQKLEEFHSQLNSSGSSQSESGKRQEIIIMDNGLVIEDIIKGNGKEANDYNKVLVNYTGQLDDGSVFDSSLKPGREPYTFTLGVGSVIKGWDLGVKGMKVGGKRKLTIPAELGYGDRGAGSVIPPGTTLIFVVELLKVETD